VTHQNLVSVKNINIPAGSYMISAVTDFHDNWTLIMRQQSGQSKYLELPPKSVRKLASRDEAVTIRPERRTLFDALELGDIEYANHTGVHGMKVQPVFH